MKIFKIACLVMFMGFGKLALAQEQQIQLDAQYFSLLEQAGVPVEHGTMTSRLNTGIMTCGAHSNHGGEAAYYCRIPAYKISINGALAKDLNQLFAEAGAPTKIHPGSLVRTASNINCILVREFNSVPSCTLKLKKGISSPSGFSVGN